MSGSKFLADTNALIYLLGGNSCMKPYASLKMGYSVISEMEILSFSKLSDEEEQITRRFLHSFERILLEEPVIDRTIQLRKHYRIKLPDAMIAATAIERDIPLLTADLAFSKIAELQVELITP